MQGGKTRSESVLNGLLKANEFANSWGGKLDSGLGNAEKDVTKLYAGLIGIALEKQVLLLSSLI